MRKKIAIFGSTGSIGKSTLNIVKKNYKDFKVELLTTNKNVKLLIKQSKIFDVKNLIIHDYEKFKFYEKILKKRKLNLFNSFSDYKKKNKNKFDYTMFSISGLDGLSTLLNIISCTKDIAIANKEAIICGWNLIKKKLLKNKTKFYPVDSEHFSIWSLLDDKKYSSNIEKIYITASGGPFLNLKKKQFKKIKLKDALKHPNWSMGKKITIDSSTLMNKIFEVIEARNIFNIPYKNIKILVHPKSYVHAIVKFNNGLIKMLIHETSMEVPIFNTIYNEKKIKRNFISNEIDINKLNNLNFSNADDTKFPSQKVLSLLPNNHSLFETVLVAANDRLVDLFLKKKIGYNDIIRLLLKTIKLKEFQKYKKKSPNSVEQIVNLSKYVHLKLTSLSV